MPDTPSYPQSFMAAFQAANDVEINDWSTIEACFKLRELEAQQHLIQAGDYANDMCVILKGLLRVYYVDQSGNEVNQHFYQANEVFAPISAIISNEPCQYYIQALEDSELMLADYHQLHEVVKDNADWLRLEIKMLQGVFVKNARHEAQLLMGNAEQRYKWFRKEYPDLLERLPQYHVASFLGITPVSLSRLRAKLEGGR
ncbi:MAG: Crp/Fnr family transcriptional regulator [Pseudomonadales bacterium]|nr:Crp/Fnr family transcriptional regulator [Pseudomonadales bacterium]